MTQVLILKLTRALLACPASELTLVKTCASQVVIETVYRNLTVLQRRDEVERRPGAGRDACWGPTEATQRSARNRPA